MRRLPPSVASLVTLYEEITEAGDVTFEWPAVPPGTQATFELTQAPAESTATASLSGVLDGADLPGAYVLERTCSLMGHAVRKDVAVAFFDGAIVEEALAWAAPATVSVAAGQTTATVTWPAPTGGAGDYTYSTPSLVFDSQGASSTLALSSTGTPGTTTLSGLVNAQTVVLTRTATDADGAQVSVQAVATVGATSASLTPGTAPAGQSLEAGTTTLTIGTWGAPSGGTGPYTYGLTEISGGGTTISGSGLGEWSASGASDGLTYAFLLTITDSLGAKGYSVVTISVAASENLGLYEVVDECDFTDSNWTALSSTDATASTTVPQHTLYAADGTTPRALIVNVSTAARTLSLSPSGSGLQLVNGTAAVQPYIGVWPVGWAPLLGGSRRDVWLIEAVMEHEEPAGSGAFVHTTGITTTTSPVASPATGTRITNTGSNSLISVISYISGADTASVATVPAGASRLARYSAQVTISDSRQHSIYVSAGATDYRDPETGLRFQVQTASSTLTAAGGERPTSASWFVSTLIGRTKWALYHDGTATSDSAVRLKKLRLLRLPQGSR